MKIMRISFILSLIIIRKINANSLNKSSLVLLQIIHRHGDRTPLDFYRNDPYSAMDQWADGLGELTPKGKHRLYYFGQEMRKRYGEYLGESPKNIYSRSSASNRCLESASAFVTGLYPPKNRWIWSQNDSLAQLWQPIAIQTILKSSDGLLVPSSKCPAADEAYEEILQSKEVIDFMSSQKDFIEKLNEKTGENYTELRKLEHLSNTLNTELDFDEPKPMPKWINELGNDTLDRLKQFELNGFKWSSKKLQRLRAGLMFKELTTNMKNIVKSNNSDKHLIKKVYSYSTHDSIIVTILQSLGLYSGIPPSYGSALLFELHQIDSKYFVQLFYANVTPILKISELNLKVCHLNESQSICKLENFIESVNEFIPNDWHKECQTIKNKNYYEKSGFNSYDYCRESYYPFRDLLIGFGIGVSTVLGLILFKIIFVKIKIFFRKRENRYF